MHSQSSHRVSTLAINYNKIDSKQQTQIQRLLSIEVQTLKQNIQQILDQTQGNIADLYMDIMSPFEKTVIQTTLNNTGSVRKAAKALGISQGKTLNIMKFHQISLID